MLNCKIYINKGLPNEQEFTDYAQFIDVMMESKALSASDIVYDSARRNRLSSQLKLIHLNGRNLHTNQQVDDTNTDLDYNVPTGKHQIGVTKFLSGLTVGESLLFPEFIEDNYWLERRKDWEKGQFKIEEQEVIFNKDVNGNYVIDPNIDLNEAEAKIKEKWKNQAKIGTAIHRTLELFFKYRHNKTSIWKIKDENKCLELIKKELEAVHAKYLSDKCILSLINIGKSIVNQFGETALFFPELKISGETKLLDDNDNLLTLVGSIDLVVLDEQGFVHAIDYKTSPLDYINYDSAKHLTFEYQLATYEKLLYNRGIKGASVYVEPIKLINFQKQNDKWSIDDVSAMSQLVQLTSTTNENIQSNLAKIFPDIILMDDTPEQLAESLDKFKSTYFPEYVASTELNLDKIKELVEEKATYNSSTDKWVYELYNKSIVKDTKEGIVAELQDIFSSDSSIRHKRTINVKNKIKQSLNNLKNTGSPSRIEYNDYNGSDDWINNYLDKYLNAYWEVLDGNDITDYHGIILLKNNITKQIDAINISTAMLEGSLKLNKGKLITGSLQSDIKEESKGNRLVLDGMIGNMELMKTVAVLDHMPNLFDEYVIGEIAVINPKAGHAITAPNEAIEYNYRLLYETKPYTESSHIYNKDIKFANHFTIFSNQFKEIMTLYKDKVIKDKNWEKFEPSLDILSTPYTSNFEKRAALIELRDKMKETWKSLDTSKFTSFTSPHYILYKSISLAILETSNVELPQIYQDGEKWIEDINIFKHGIASLELDNPGNFKDKNLNIITKLTMNAYQNVREHMQTKIPVVYEAVQKLKDKKGYSFLKERTIGNPAELYKNMIVVENGNIYIKNPWRNSDYGEGQMSEEEVEFVKFFLKEVNKNRYPNISIDQVQNNSHHKYFQLPLMKGDMKSDVVMSGIWNAFKHKLKSLHPANIVRTTQDEVQEVKAERLFEMGTSFDRGEGRDRINYISERTKDLGIGYFETNLETLLFAHMFSYSTKNAINEIFPDIEAVVLNIKYSAFTGNTSYENLTEYIENFIKSKIFKRNIDDKKWDPVMAYSKQVMKFASYLALAFNPRQIYQFLEGIWKDIMLIQRSLAREDESFTFEHLFDSFLSTLPEMIHYTNGRTKWEALNQLYAINDMGIDEYVDRIKSDKYGIWGFFNRVAFHFASRPDFYNRATIFGAQMRKDGCWEAHKWEDGKLTYDWTLDTRFDRFANNNKSDIELYNKQKALYLTMARQMETDKTINPDGTLFRMKNENGEFNPLPKAYTIQQSESLKDVADSIYGYYSSEKKSMIQAHTLGAMIMQMNTYWSAKKNQYLAPGSVKLQGQLKIVEGLYLDENGEITETNTGIPYMRWEGDFQEGIILTLSHFFTYKGNFKERWNFFWDNDDENLRRAYRQNLHQLGYDMFMVFVFGQMIAGGIQNSAKTYVKESDNPIANLTVNFAANVFRQSFIDYNFLDSIFGRGLNWTPFSLSTAERLLNSASEVLSGDMTAKTAILNTYGLTRELKPYFRTIERNEN